MDEPRPKTDDEIRSIVQRQLEQAIGYDGRGDLPDSRIKALRYYRGEKFGNEVEGRSQIVSRDVAEVVDGMLPALLKPFVSGDETVKFEPRGPEDEESAQQATDYANYIWNVDNPGFHVAHDWIKDGLLARLGVIKIWWEKEEQPSRTEYGGLTQEEVDALSNDPSTTGIEVTPSSQEMPEQQPQMGPDGMPIPPEPPPLLFDAVVKRLEKKGSIKVRNLPPEEFLIGREGVEADGRPFCAHRCKRTLSDLREAKIPEEILAEISFGGGSDLDIDREKRDREDEEQSDPFDASDDPAQEEVTVAECYLKIDADGDGIAEYRKITMAGDPAGKIIDNKEVDDHPFAWWCPYPIPHKFHGESAADKVMDVQLTKSALLRQMLDNLYLINNARTEIVEGKVNLDDFLSSKPGGYVRTKEMGSMREIVVPPVFQNAFPALEYFDTVRENRSGATRYNQGMDADSLNKTAAGIQAIMGKAADRLELIARVFAETGMRRAFRIILRLLTRYQDKPRMIRLRNDWVPLDPKSWNVEMDVTVSVGLGTGNKDQQLQHLMAVWQKQMEAAQLQGGFDGQLVKPQNFYETATKIVINAGFKNAEAYFSDPSQSPPPQPQPDPAMVKAQAEIEANKAKMGAELELQKVKQDGEMELKHRELAVKAAQGFYQPQPRMFNDA